MYCIVSLIASSTEIICALGLEDQLVGISHECDFPPSITHLPRCTEFKFGEHALGKSYDIDQRVKAIVQEGLSVYRVDGEKLRALQPDIIITQTQCEVCAVSLKDVEAAVCELTASKANVVSLETNCLADLWRDIMKVADALDVHERGVKLVESLQERIRDVAIRVQDSTKKPTVACIEWIDPLMSAGNWMPELVELSGGVNLFGVAGKHSPWMTWEELVAKNPDFIFVLPCGFDIQRTLTEMHLLSSRPEWEDLTAVQNRSVIVADGNQYFNRPGPRLIDSLEILAEVIQPDLFHFGHEGKGWVPFPGSR
ncbi:MAG: cobalamin-binding protein [Deltaproteobacteria bacterium]|nr:cobalamin-binding protein [Deltaproteobacteria bacterium]